MERVYIPGGEGTGVYLRGWLPQLAINLWILLLDYLQKHMFTFTDTQTILAPRGKSLSLAVLHCLCQLLFHHPVPVLSGPLSFLMPPFPVHSLLILLSLLLQNHCMVSSF